MPFQVDIVVTNPDGQKATLSAAFEFQPSPVISAVSPASGPAAGGTVLTITGANFAQGATVLIGDKPAENVVVSEDGSSIQAVTPAV